MYSSYSIIGFPTLTFHFANRNLKNLKEQINIFPMLIIEEFAEIDDESAHMLKTKVVDSKTVIQYGSLGGMVLGLLLALFGLVCLMVGGKKPQEIK